VSPTLSTILDDARSVREGGTKHERLSTRCRRG